MLIGTVRFELPNDRYIKVEEYSHPITGTYWDVRVILFDINAEEVEEVLDSYCLTDGSSTLVLLSELNEKWNNDD